jgi:hypothetical protein
MAKWALKLILGVLTVYGGFNLVKDLSPLWAEIATSPQVTRSPTVKSAIDVANQVLPQNQQLGLPEITTETTPEIIEKTITQIITEKVSQTASTTTDNLSKAAHDQVCQEILTKVIDQCGTPD